MSLAERLLATRARLAVAVVLAVTLVPISIVLGTAPNAGALPSDFDLTFGTGGIASVLPFEPRYVDSQLYGTALHPDGRILAVGAVPSASTKSDLLVVRYLADGKPDTTFGTGGRVVTDTAGREHGAAVSVDPAGNVVVLIAADDSDYQSPDRTPARAAMARYRPDGSADLTFGGRGWVDVPFYSDHLASSMAILPDGRILVGAVGRVGSSGAAVQRLLSDGRVDQAFPTREPITAWNPPGIFIQEQMTSLAGIAVQPDGRFLVVGNNFDSSGGRLAVGPKILGFNADGTTDETYGDAGAVTGIGSTATSLFDLALQPDGKLVVVGEGKGRNSFDLHVLRFEATGSLDPSFGEAGQVTTAVGNAQNSVTIALDTSRQGAVTVAGWASAPAPGEPYIPGQTFVAQLTPQGRLDARFGAGGIATYLFNGRSTPHDLVVQADGKPILWEGRVLTSQGPLASSPASRARAPALQPRHVASRGRSSYRSAVARC